MSGALPEKMRGSRNGFVNQPPVNGITVPKPIFVAEARLACRKRMFYQNLLFGHVERGPVVRPHQAFGIEGCGILIRRPEHLSRAAKEKRALGMQDDVPPSVALQE